MAELVPLSAFLETAQEVVSNPRRTFAEWQRIGLLGRHVRKASRRGGEGLWHSAQFELWKTYLRHRKERVRLATLANLPIGGWLLGWDGVELDQAQKALLFWICQNGSPDRPSGERSLRRRGIETIVEELAHSQALKRDKVEASKVFEQQLDAIPEMSVSEATFVKALTPLLAKENRRDVRLYASSLYGVIEVTSSALPYVEDLCRLNTREIKEFWIWARNLFHVTYAEYTAEIPHLSDAPDTGRFFVPYTLERFMNTACATLLQLFGYGIKYVLRECDFPNHRPRPPVITLRKSSIQEHPVPSGPAQG